MLFGLISGWFAQLGLDTLDISEFGLFGHILLFGTLVSVCFNVVGSRIMMSALYGFNSLTKPGIYGGKK
ncbi:MAG: hypothetical protein RSC55_06825, partial [Oscillospiraceae bacterium]